MLSWLTAFVATQCLEVPLYLGLLQTRPLSRRFGLAFSASTLTHPVVWFAFPILGRAWGLSYWEMVALAEVYAVVIEAVLLFIMGERRAWWVSLLANATSLFVGLGLRSLGAPI